MSRSRGTPSRSAARSQEARRLPYSPSAREWATRVSTTSTARPCAAGSNGMFSTVPGPGVEQQHGALLRRRRTRSGPSARTAPRRSRSPPVGRAGRSSTGRARCPESADTASTVTHSTAAEDDSPAPDGTWESRTRSNRFDGAPGLRAAPRWRPAGTPASRRPPASPGRCRPAPRSRPHPVFWADTTRTLAESPRPAASCARASMANGSTRPPL